MATRRPLGRGSEENAAERSSMSVGCLTDTIPACDERGNRITVSYFGKCLTANQCLGKDGLTA